MTIAKPDKFGYELGLEQGRRGTCVSADCTMCWAMESSQTLTFELTFGVHAAHCGNKDSFLVGLSADVRPDICMRGTVGDIMSAVSMPTCKQLGWCWYKPGLGTSGGWWKTPLVGPFYARFEFFKILSDWAQDAVDGHCASNPASTCLTQSSDTSLVQKQFGSSSFSFSFSFSWGGALMANFGPRRRACNHHGRVEKCKANLKATQRNQDHIKVIGGYSGVKWDRRRRWWASFVSADYDLVDVTCNSGGCHR